MATMTKKKKKSMKVSSSSSSSMLIDIPNDVIRHILSLLSARYLMRLRWVCKYWFNLITHDLSFIKMHLHDHQQSIQHYPTILIHNPETYSEGITQYNYDDDDAWEGRRRRCPLNIKLYDHPAQKHEYKVLGSCNGLLLMSLFSRTSLDEGRESTFLWNPCTKEFKTLPDIPIEEEDKNSSFQIFGFGYDCIIDDYKVISVRNSKRYDETVMAIYTLGTNSWRRVGGFPPYELQKCRTRTLCNGALYSFAWNGILRRGVLLSFDIVKEECKQITKMSQLPKPTYICYDNHNLGEFKGCLCLFITLWDSSNKISLEVWRLMKDEHSSSSGEYTGEESWTKIYTITRQKFTPVITKWLQPLRICNNGEILMMVNHKDVVWYNPKDDDMRFVATISESPNLNITVTAPIGIYIESLVSLKTGTYMGQELLRRRRRIDTKEEEKNDNKKKKSC